MKYKIITCERCKSRTYLTHPLKRFCSEKCRKAAEDERRRERKVYRKKKKRIALRKTCVRIKGGKCARCGKTKLSSLQFHHRNPCKKRGNISTLIRNNAWKIVLTELKKCDLLCVHCHKEEHK